MPAHERLGSVPVPLAPVGHPGTRQHDDWRQRGLVAAGSDEITGRQQADAPGTAWSNLVHSGQLSARLRQHG
jgi:hypothetical protein